MFNNVNDAINWIENIKRNNKENTLKRMTVALDILGHPEKSYKTVHITGTNGKGSTLNYISNILINSGLKVGSFVSPYLVCFNERIQINNEYISDNDLIKYTNIIYDVCKKVEDKINDIVSFFEVTTLIGLLYFKEKQIDVAVIEVGMGGKLDATNIINANLSIITNVALDHMNSLGNTKEEIAINKLGIVKENGYLLTGIDESLMPLVLNKCQKVNAGYKKIAFSNIKYSLDKEWTTFTYNKFEYKLKMLGKHQINNAVLAIEAINYLFPKIKEEVIRQGLYNSFWRGRLELIYDNPIIYIDGAHNVHAVKALVDFLDNVLDKDVHLLFCALDDKETKEMLNILENSVKDITITTIDDIRAKDPKLLYDEISIKEKSIIYDYKMAINGLINKYKDTKEVILVSGSLHFISIIRKYLLNIK